MDDKFLHKLITIFIYLLKNKFEMIKPLATMLTVWGLLMFLITFFVYLNHPSSIDYNGGVKYSMVDSGVAVSFLLSTVMLLGGIVLLKLSKVPRFV
jgi:hypothetical protein